jgi:hypothetical protein
VTNHHVLHTPAGAAAATVVFDDEEGRAAVRCQKNKGKQRNSVSKKRLT